MQMNTDFEKIKRWREDRLWSQEQLAGIAGVSLRTVQRLETGESVSRDTLKALAAAFGVEANALAIDARAQAARASALKTRQFVFSAWVHLATYIFVIGLLLAINLAGRPDEIWMTWPAIGWGIGVAAHGLAAFIVSRAPSALE